MKLLNFRHSSSGINVHWAQLCHPCWMQHVRTPHHVAFPLAWHPGQESLTNLRHVPQNKPHAAISGFITIWIYRSLL
ncbi:MAG TPA: hypothetical protein H9779_01345 [Candidatus Alistipes avicola]|uniref:Uncharacterized protein n=1 Tax=Candidatus Alistipes avicola TaxID=2838432 RepID=A0A9D2IE24_9BACT|nr:hypothetical protein [Candidatus Alistipes avicola]